MNLDIGQCRLKDEGLDALMATVEAGGLRSLERLILQRNVLGDTACALVFATAAKWLPRLVRKCAGAGSTMRTVAKHILPWRSSRRR